MDPSAQFSAHRPVVMGIDWMITADHPLAAQAGAAVLQAGGNAVDAAVAANLVMAVVRPHMCGIGGDLFALVYMAAEGRLKALNASGRAPGRASRDFYLAQGLDKIPETGILTATVPGAIDGWEQLLSRCGTRTLADLLPPAIHYAERGFPAYGDFISAIVLMQEALAAAPAAAGIFLPGGRVPGVGEIIRQPALAGSLKKLAALGGRAFYQGDLGRSLVEYSRSLGGLFELEDLAAHCSDWQEPLCCDFHGLTLCTSPPNSQGIALLMQANILENLDLAALGHNHSDYVHHCVEAKKLAFADRDRYVCDPDFQEVPLEQLLSKSQAKKQAARIDPERAALAPAARNFSAAGSDTIYLAVVDPEGNAVSLIQSLFMHFGSCLMDPATGLIPHNRARGFSLAPDHPNRLEPHKRPYHTLHPAMVLKGGLPYLVLGTPGADGQTQTVMQVLANILVFGADVQQAVEAPRWRSNPDGTLLLEGRFAPQVVEDLVAKAHQAKVVADIDEVMGSAQVIMVDRENHILQAGACPRRQAYAIGR